MMYKTLSKDEAQKRLLQLKNLQDVLNDFFDDYCLHDPSVGIIGPSEFEHELIKEIKDNLYATQVVLEEELNGKANCQ